MSFPYTYIFGGGSSKMRFRIGFTPVCTMSFSCILLFPSLDFLYAPNITSVCVRFVTNVIKKCEIRGLFKTYEFHTGFHIFLCVHISRIYLFGYLSFQAFTFSNICFLNMFTFCIFVSRIYFTYSFFRTVPQFLRRFPKIRFFRGQAKSLSCKAI